MNVCAAPSLGIDTARLQQLRGALRFAPVRGPLYFANAAIVLGLLVFMLWILTQLRGLFRTLRDGRPLVAANATRLRRIAVGGHRRRVRARGRIFLRTTTR